MVHILVHLKLGQKKYEIPNNKYLVKPLIRFPLSTICDDCDLVISVKENVDTSKEIKFEKMLEIYKDLLDENIDFLDIKHNNFGKLLKDNKAYWDKTLRDYNGIIGECNEELKAGDYVIFDLNYTFYSDDEEKEYPITYNTFLNKLRNYEYKNFHKVLMIKDMDMFIDYINSYSSLILVKDFIDNVICAFYDKPSELIKITRVHGFKNFINDNILSIINFLSDDKLDEFLRYNYMFIDLDKIPLSKANIIINHYSFQKKLIR